MSIANTNIVKHLRSSDTDYEVTRPPRDIDYHDRFIRFDGHMSQNIHQYVNPGAAASGSTIFTDHGPKHVETVIRRIEDLTYIGDRFVLSPYDTYLILLAAHFHDVGNLYGRENHERLLRKAVFDVDHAYIGDDAAEKRIICDIAMAHGGTVGVAEDKDTIGRLQHDRRIKRLAAILRLADELSDDRSRTSDIVIDAVTTTTPGSTVYHLYSDRLNTPEISHDQSSIRLSFELLRSHLTDQYEKDGTSIFLLDEIMERTLKTHREQIYCGKFMLPDIVSERTEVDISICTERYEDVVGTVNYVLEQTGYPSWIDDIRRLAPRLASLSGALAAQNVDSVFALCPSGYETRQNLLPLLCTTR